MTSAICRRSFAALATLAISVSAWALPDPADTLLLTQPAVSRTHIAFIYAEDLWIAGLDGSNARRLTSDRGIESTPAFSPDGTRIAFSAQYDGNTDVYVIAVAGGVPTRLTWHPGADTVRGFTPDGARVLFTSARAVFTGRYTQFFTVPVGGGLEEALPIPNAYAGSFSPDGASIAYNPISPAHTQWKHYRGGTNQTITLYATATHATARVPQPAARANDADPMWLGHLVYFRSDRNGEFNLYSFDPATKTIAQLTTHDDFPVLSAGAGHGRIVYEQAGRLHVYEVATGKATALKIAAPTDLAEVRTRFARGARWIRQASLSPSGARVAVEFRGEVLTVPAEKGDARNLTQTTGAHERSPAWSPDGASVAYISDAGGEYALHIRKQDGTGDARVIALKGAGFYSKLEWSPDSARIALTDNAMALWVVDVAAGTVREVSREPVYGPSNPTEFDWSPDSKWLAYTRGSTAYINAVYLWSVASGTSTRVTDGLSDVTEPVFDKSGKYLFMFASTDAGPVADWFSQANADMRVTRTIYIAVLARSTPSPLVKESDEEKGRETKPDEKKAGDAKDAPAPTVIDIDGLDQRLLALPIPPADLSVLRAGTAGQVYYLRSADGTSVVRRYDLASRKDEVVVPKAFTYDVAFDGKKLLYGLDDDWYVVPATGKVEAGSGRVPVDRLEVRVDPPAEWAQIFNEAWRINRDYFYAVNFHGVDWPAMRTKYARFVPHVAVRSDLNRVIQWMSSELAVGHHRVGGGDRLDPPRTVSGGLLGADYEIANGRYRFKKVYGGLNWNPGLRAPLTEPGVGVKPGDYLMAVNGTDLRPPTNIYALFENTAGTAVSLTVGPSADGAGTRIVTVVPIDSESALRNRDWVEGNLRKVTDATGGRVAYVYVPNTAELGHTYFKRYFFPQTDRDAIIVDERFNGGGSVADYYIDLLRRPFIAWWAMRYGTDLKTPIGSIQGPKAMIIDETAGSGGDLLPWMFRKFQLGPIIGKRTWGGLVGILGFPVLMDGGSITAPNVAIWVEGDGWVVENEGVPPDIEVEQTPADVIAGRDPQLEKAIEVVMAELRKNPVKRPSRPPFPVRRP